MTHDFLSNSVVGSESGLEAVYEAAIQKIHDNHFYFRFSLVSRFRKL